MSYERFEASTTGPGLVRPLFLSAVRMLKDNLKARPSVRCRVGVRPFFLCVHVPLLRATRLSAAGLAGVSPSDGAQVAAVKAAAWRVAGNY
jgi:hypothetical protein